MTHNDNKISREWANRPNDERFLSLESLHAAVSARKNRSRPLLAKEGQLFAIGTEEDQLFLDTVDGPAVFNNWSFGQIASQAGAPGRYLEKIPAGLAADCINYGLVSSQLGQKATDSLLLLEAQEEGASIPVLRASTSPSYGRIWDRQVVEAVINLNDRSGGRWVVPSASYSAQNPKRATTLYASDRDVFIFLCDPSNPIEVNGETLFRGFYTWNSEVGSATFGIATFLYRYICDNRIIWGQSQKSEFKIRHTGGAPERFADEATHVLNQYAESSAQEVVEKIHKAKQTELGHTDEALIEGIAKKGFTITQSKQIFSKAQEEEGGCRTVWDAALGITALAIEIPNTDMRIRLEAKAGRMLEEVC